MGPSLALSSVLILIGTSSPWRGLSSYSIVGLSRAISYKLLFFSCIWSNVNFSSSSQGPGMAWRVRTLNLNWKGLHFLGLLASIPILSSSFPLPQSSWESNCKWPQPGIVCCGTGPGICNQEDLAPGRPSCVVGFDAADSYSLRLSWQPTLYIEKLSFLFIRWRASQSVFFSALLIAQIPIWDVSPVNKDNLLSVVLWLKYSDTSNSEGWGFLISFFTAQSLSGNASLWIWKELRDIITNGPIIMWRILPWDSSPVSTDTETLWTLWKSNVKEIYVIHC